jgi:ADP-heptose:LPS heptosyltransferase
LSLQRIMNPRPLLVRFGALGDMTILTVMIRLLYERFGERVDIVGSGGWTRPLLEGQYGVGDIYLIGSRRWPYFASPEQWALTRTLRARGPSATWLCDQHNQKTLRVLKWAGWTAAHSCHYSGLQDLPGPHMCDLWQRFAFRDPQVLGGKDHPLPRRLPQAHGELVIDSSQRIATTEWLASQGIGDRPLILIQAGNKRTMRSGGHRRRASNTKYWPELNWCAVLRGLRAQHPDHAILLLGTPAEESLNNDICHLANIPHCYNLAHDAPIPRLMALAERAVGTISVDTGPAHVAAAVGCAVVTLFGKASPKLYAPRGPDTQVVCLTGIYDGKQSMLGITPHQVLEAWQSILRGKRESDGFGGISAASKVDTSQRAAQQLNQPLPEAARQ